MQSAQTGAEDLFLTSAEVAQRLNIKPNTLSVWRRRNQAGAPPFLKLCGAVRYRASAIEAWLKANEKCAAI